MPDHFACVEALLCYCLVSIVVFVRCIAADCPVRAVRDVIVCGSVVALRVCVLVHAWICAAGTVAFFLLSFFFFCRCTNKQHSVMCQRSPHFCDSLDCYDCGCRNDDKGLVGMEKICSSSLSRATSSIPISSLTATDDCDIVRTVLRSRVVSCLFRRASLSHHTQSFSFCARLVGG